MLPVSFGIADKPRSDTIELEMCISLQHLSVFSAAHAVMSYLRLEYCPVQSGTEVKCMSCAISPPDISVFVISNVKKISGGYVKTQHFIMV